MDDKLHVLRDSQEQKGWNFLKSQVCDGTTVVKLPTGDYTIRGYENDFIIERKADTGEFCKNINEARFTRELERMESFKYPFVVLEFTMEDIMKFPHNSGIPEWKWKTLRVSPFFILKRLLEYEMQYKTKFILAGEHGQKVAWSLMKRVSESINKTAKS